MNIDLASIGTFVSQLVTQPIHWLWHNRIPLGHLTLLEGPTALGKLLLTLDIAAHTSGNRPFPGDQHGAPGSVILISPNDHHTDTLKPRLEAANADPTKILLLDKIPQDNPASPQRSFTLPEDLEILETAITRIAATLVIIQPLDSLFSRRAASRRTIFTKLAELARRTHCAILLVRSTSGAHSDSYHLNTGPLDLLDAIDSRLLLIRDPDDSEQHLLVCTKHSLSPQPATLAYQIIPNAQEVPTIHWLGESQHPKALGLDTSLPSRQRQLILDLLQQSPTPLRPDPIAHYIDQSYQSTCKLLQRMVKIGHLISPSRGLYTTPDHPKLTQLVSSSGDEPTSTPIQTVQSVQMTDIEQSPVQMEHLDQPPVQSVQSVQMVGSSSRIVPEEKPVLGSIPPCTCNPSPTRPCWDNAVSSRGVPLRSPWGSGPCPSLPFSFASSLPSTTRDEEPMTDVEQPPVQSVQMTDIEQPPVQSVQMTDIEQPPVQTVQMTDIEQPPVQTVQLTDIEQPPVQTVQTTDLDQPPVHTVQNVAAPEMPDPNCNYGHTIVQQAPPDITGSPLPDIQCNYGHPAVQQALPDSTGHPSPDFLCIYGHRIVQKDPPDPTVYPPVQSVQTRKFSP